jgi:hypothetical protein
MMQEERTGWVLLLRCAGRLREHSRQQRVLGVPRRRLQRRLLRGAAAARQAAHERIRQRGAQLLERG